MTNNEPFRNAKVGDKVRAPQIMSGVGVIERINPFIEFSIGVRFDEGLASFTFGGKWRTQADDRALFYTNDKGELLKERPRKMVEKVVVSGKTDAWDYSKEKSGISLIVSVLPTIPIGTPYRIIVEVEE